jgi:release factor glutamine methyltransferase
MDTKRVDVLVAQGTQRLAAGPAAGASPGLDAELLLAHALGTTRTWLRAHGESLVAAAPSARYCALVERRRAGEPLAYIVGEKEFWSLKLAVSPAVLVPRPETELLIEQALALHPGPHARVLDLGTGAGAIALALASERPGWEITATDLSPAALQVARANACSLKLKHVELLQGSWYEPVAGRTFELIVSNPPYIAEDDPALLDPALRHEPRLALTPGADALASLRAIIAGAPAHLGRGGWLLLEHGSGQAPPVQRELVVQGLRHVRSHLDLAGHPRVSCAQRA